MGVVGEAIGGRDGENLTVVKGWKSFAERQKKRGKVARFFKFFNSWRLSYVLSKIINEGDVKEK
jgi:hypothetical protein